MVFHINKLSTYAQQLIQNTCSGSVHSVYRNTVNIVVNGHLLALQTKHSPLSPISLITNLNSEEFNQNNIKNGQTVTFDLTGATVFNLAPQEPIPHETRHKLYKKFYQIIQASDTHGFDMIFQMSSAVDSDLVLAVAEAKIHASNTHYRKKDYQEAARIISELVGLGTGLTPSGDDFLCGILAGYHIQGMADSLEVHCLRNAIRENLSRTNEISSAFLTCALEGHFSQAVNELWKNPDIETITQMFRAIGHSSGMDTLCGIYFLFFLME